MVKQTAKGAMFHLFAASAAVAAFTVMRLHAAGLRFWFDELITINFAKNASLSKALAEGIQTDGSTVLYNVLMWLWYKVAPYGEANLLLLSETFAAASVFVSAVTAYKISGTRSGVFAAFTAATQTIVLRYGNELRSYSLVVLLSSLLLLLYKSRIEGKRRLVAYGVCMAALVYSSPFTVFFCMALLANDAALIAGGRLRVASLLSYAVGLILYLPYFAALIGNPARIAPGTEYIMSAIDIIKFAALLLDYNPLHMVMFVCGAVVAFVRCIAKRGQEREWFVLSCVSAAIIPIALLFLANLFCVAFLKHGFDIMTRYLIFATPAMTLVIASGFDWLCGAFSKTATNPVIARTGTAVAMFAAISYSALYAVTGVAYAPKHYSDDKEYAETADYVAQSIETSAPATAVCFLTWDTPPHPAYYQAARNGWYEYYVLRKGYGFTLVGITDDIMHYDAIYILENQRELFPHEAEMLNEGYVPDETKGSRFVKVWRNNNR
jgi:uncharacterized membrane protein